MDEALFLSGLLAAGIRLATPIALAAIGERVLIIDLDPQGNASTGLGIDRKDRDLSSYDVLVGNVSVVEAAMKTAVPQLSVVASTMDLLGVEMEIAGAPDRALRLRKALHGPKSISGDYSYVLIDCPPSLNLLTVNAMVASHSVLVPLQSEFFALEGLSQLMLTIREVRQSANPNLKIEGVVLTMFDNRNNLSQQVEADARDNLGDLVFATKIPRNVRVSEAPSYAMPVLDFDPASKGAKAYRDLAQEFLKNNEMAEA
mgnify:CR=1 FL=1